MDLERVRARLQESVPRWWVPDRLEVRSELPTTSVGKYDKRILRAEAVSD